MKNATVELFDVAVKGCGGVALTIQGSSSETTVVATRCQFANSRHGVVVKGSSTSATFKNCVFNDNVWQGLIGSDKSTTHLHGEATAIRLNGDNGILVHELGKVLIHLPSHHNTVYNNKGEDRRTFGGSGSGNIITNVED